MDTHKGQTKYCVTLNDEDSNIVKITVLSLNYTGKMA